VKSVYEVLNLTMLSQIKAFIVKPSFVISAFLRYYRALNGNSLLNFWDILLVPCSRVRKSKRENGTRLKLTDKLFFSGTCPLSIFLKKHGVSEAGNEAPNLVILLN